MARLEDRPKRVRGRAWAAARALPILALALAWELFARSGKVTAFMLPPFSEVVVRIWNDGTAGQLPMNAALTLYRTLAGFMISALGGIALGVAMARSTPARWFFDPIVSIGFPMPKIAFLPIVILWLGFFDAAKIAIIVFDAIFPVITATVAGITGVERELIWSARNMGASDRGLTWQILIPAALPQIMTGLQVALPLCLIVAIIAEMMMGGRGVGAEMMMASRFADSRGVFAGIVEIAALGYCLVRGMAILRRRLLLWHPEALEPGIR
jgi:ABC-type nitrate/sulfonate/bicarbonate transport system permease component